MAIYQLQDKIPYIHASAWVADTATVIGNVLLHQAVSVWFNAVVRGDNEPISIGIGSNVQEGAVLHTDMGYPLTISEHVTIGHQAMLHGCTVGEGSLIGIQAVILNGAVIGKHCLVAAGAVVTEQAIFPDGSLIVGAPAQLKRIMTLEQQAQLLANSAAYVQHSQVYRMSLKRIA